MDEITISINPDTMQVEVRATAPMRPMAQEALRGLGFIYHEYNPEHNWNNKTMSTHLHRLNTIVDMQEILSITYKVLMHIEYRLFFGDSFKVGLKQTVG